MVLIAHTQKIYIFIGQENKLRANFGCFQMSILVRLFKNYNCTFYGSQVLIVNLLTVFVHLGL